LKAIMRRTVSVDEYMDSLPQRFKSKFLERKMTYQLNKQVVRELRKCGKNMFIVVFSAEWCKDCAVNVPVLALLAERTEIKVRVFGGLKTDPLNPRERWRIPPSPPEVNAFDVVKTPHIIMFDRQGKQLGTIVENPKSENTLEEEILEIICQQSYASARTET
jgi:thiol-disulfide isomerase/thioredoxin